MSTNRLIHATSPYLLQHAHNPVDWQPWDDVALEQARAENRPIFLSIGYSSCHWCHVMERESFEDDETAALLNAHFVCIKVDREERPDLDEIYMSAVQLMTQSGGWPMSVFLTPDLRPFYCGTYFPPRDAYGRPGFKTLLRFLIDLWRTKRDELDRAAEQLTFHLRKSAEERLGAPEPLDVTLLDGACDAVAAAFDPEYGGFQGAPKFPSAPMVSLLLRQALRANDASAEAMAAFTLERMALGGIYDHLGGGFHRYSVDERWLVPHFEKMLYDNAQLAQVYLEGYQRTRNPLFRRVAEETLDYVLRDMTSAEGAFYSAEDADSGGEEGAFYVWTRDEILRALGEEDGALFAQCYDVHAGGNFDSHEAYHAGKNILHRPRALDEIAEKNGMSLEALEGRLAELRTFLRQARAGRVRPGLDDKALTSWNALMISALARAAQVLDRDDYAVAAARAATHILERVTDGARLLRVYREGRASQPAFLDDHAFLVVALTDLYEATFDRRWLESAARWADAMLSLFWDDSTGGFFSCPAEQGDLIARVKPVYDRAEPSGNTMAALGLLRLGRLLGEERYHETAARTLELNAVNLRAAPLACLKLLCVADLHLAPPREAVLAGALDDPRAQALLAALRAPFSPNTVVAQIDPVAPDAEAAQARIPLLRGRTLIDGAPAAYVCENYACRQPVTTPEEVASLL